MAKPRYLARLESEEVSLSIHTSDLQKLAFQWMAKADACR